MKYLKPALIFFFVVDALIFVLSQVSPELLVQFLPQFDLATDNHNYTRLVGILFLALGTARLYGGLRIAEKGAFMISIWSWVIELIYTLSELIRGSFLIGENVMALVLAPGMLIWSILYFNRTFRRSIEAT